MLSRISRTARVRTKTFSTTIFWCNGQAIYNILESTESGEGKSGCVPIDLSTNLVEQPIDLFLSRPAHTTFLQVDNDQACYLIG